MGTILSGLHIDASYLVAVVLVAFYAAGRFNTPKTVRSQTSQFQYFASCTVYVLSSLGLLVLLTWLLEQKPELLGFLHFGSATAVPDELKGLDVALVAALVLTTLLPHFPFLRDLDARMLRFFHRMGSIPVGAVLWAQRMMNTQYAISPQMLGSIRDFIHDSPVLPNGLTQELQPDREADVARFRFTRNLALYVAIARMPAAMRFGSDFPEDYASFGKTATRFFAQSVGYFAIQGERARWQPAAQAEILQESDSGYKDLSSETYEAFRLMLARVLLYSCAGQSEVAQKLRVIGYAIETPPHIRIPLNLLALDVVGVVVLFVAFPLLSSGNMPLSTAIALAILVAANHCIAALFALLPKQFWGFADFRCTGERPILAYLLSGLCSLTVSLPLSYAFYWLRKHVLDLGPVMAFSGQSKWLLLSFMLAVSLAFACDDHIGAERDPPWLRWVEAGAIAVVMAAAGWLVLAWVRPDQLAIRPGSQPAWMAVVLSACIGALFGATIPSWYRTSVRATEDAWRLPRNPPVGRAPAPAEG